MKYWTNWLPSMIILIDDIITAAASINHHVATVLKASELMAMEDISTLSGISKAFCFTYGQTYRISLWKTSVATEPFLTYQMVLDATTKGVVHGMIPKRV